MAASLSSLADQRHDEEKADKSNHRCDEKGEDLGFRQPNPAESTNVALKRGLFFAGYLREGRVRLGDVMSMMMIILMMSRGRHLLFGRRREGDRRLDHFGRRCVRG
jgi:hypothetical protein